jgi:hypothetical protein
MLYLLARTETDDFLPAVGPSVDGIELLDDRRVAAGGGGGTRPE